MEVILENPYFPLPPPDYIPLIPVVPLEGHIKIKIPFDLHKKPENRIMKPASLSITLIGKSAEDQDVFFMSPPKKAWKKSGSRESRCASVLFDDGGIDFRKLEALKEKDPLKLQYVFELGRKNKQSL
jgi:hypothetical protein